MKAKMLLIMMLAIFMVAVSQERTITFTDKKTDQTQTVHYSQISKWGTHRKFGDFVRVNKKSIYIKEDVAPIGAKIVGLTDNGAGQVIIYPHRILDVGEEVITTIAFIPNDEPFIITKPQGFELISYDFVDRQYRAGTGAVDLFDYIITQPDNEIRISILPKANFGDAVKYINAYPELERPIILNMAFRFTASGDYYLGVNGGYFSVK